MNKVLNKLKLVSRRKLDPKIIKQLSTGGKASDYIAWTLALDALESVFDRVDIEYPEHWWQECVDKKISPKKFNNNETANVNQQAVKYEKQNPVVFVKCKVTAYYKDDNGEEKKIIKESFGSKTVIGGQTEQQSHFKSAASDALKKVIVLFGFGRELYRDNMDTMYLNNTINNLFSNDAIKIAYKTSYDIIANIASLYKMDAYTINSFVYAWSKGKYFDLDEENIEEFSQWLAKLYSYETPATTPHQSVPLSASEQTTPPDVKLPF